MIAKRLDLYRAASACLGVVAGTSWSAGLERMGDGLTPDGVVFFADEFDPLDIHRAVQRELSSAYAQCVVVITRHREDYLSLCSLPGAASRLTILPLSIWGLALTDTIASFTDPHA